MEYLFLFPLMQKLQKSIKKCKTYSRKATGLFFPGHGAVCGSVSLGGATNVAK